MAAVPLFSTDFEQNGQIELETGWKAFWMCGCCGRDTAEWTQPSDRTISAFKDGNVVVCASAWLQAGKSSRYVFFTKKRTRREA